MIQRNTEQTYKGCSAHLCLSSYWRTSFLVGGVGLGIQHLIELGEVPSNEEKNNKSSLVYFLYCLSNLRAVAVVVPRILQNANEFSPIAFNIQKKAKCCQEEVQWKYRNNTVASGRRASNRLRLVLKNAVLFSILCRKFGTTLRNPKIESAGHFAQPPLLGCMQRQGIASRPLACRLFAAA
ncbi:hypothetical protein CEXT_162601 [Caerostris extrusa]|uniref:Uncharacterized protein n=1 Tax=Caerostris extrusa TaxID=172846 RepID=A0AAV4MH26_CAEEX|nr:hypothetical protein CEXT_162601 [Caerostris extrusa]